MTFAPINVKNVQLPSVWIDADVLLLFHLPVCEVLLFEERKVRVNGDIIRSSKYNNPRIPLTSICVAVSFGLIV